MYDDDDDEPKAKAKQQHLPREYIHEQFHVAAAADSVSGRCNRCDGCRKWFSSQCVKEVYSWPKHRQLCCQCREATARQ